MLEDIMKPVVQNLRTYMETEEFNNDMNNACLFDKDTPLIIHIKVITHENSYRVDFIMIEDNTLSQKDLGYIEDKYWDLAPIINTFFSSIVYTSYVVCGTETIDDVKLVMLPSVYEKPYVTHGEQINFKIKKKR